MGHNTLKKVELLDCLGLSAIGSYVLASALYGSNFSEQHISFDFLSFPVFIGEFLILFCLILLYLRNKLKPILWQAWQEMLWIYLVLVVAKALWDYGHWGPLAFRNAAMYYYPIFMLFSYVFFNPRYFSLMLKIFIAILLCFLVSIFSYIGYFWISGVFLFFVIQSFIKPRLIKLLLCVAFILFCDYRMLGEGSRTNLISSIAACMFFIYVFVSHFVKLSWQKKTLLVVGLTLVMSFYFQWSSDRNGVRSLVKVQEAISIYKENKAIINEKISTFEPSNFKVQLYHDNLFVNSSLVMEDSQNPKKINDAIEDPFYHANLFVNSSLVVEDSQNPKKINDAIEDPLILNQSHIDHSDFDSNRIPVKINQHHQNKAILDKDFPQPRAAASPVAFKDQRSDFIQTWTEKMSRSQNIRTLDSAQNNMIFRVFIWEDMFRELIKERAWFGIGLGKPQRSISLEILAWGMTEWSRDGWITPHNSYFHMIYRLGILGLGLILILILSVTHLAKCFIKLKSYPGILLVAILIYWFMTANFLVILEFPHYAILIWTVFGVASAYKDSLYKGIHKEVGT